MAKYAPVGPIAIMEDLHRKGVLGDYVLVLAHDVEYHCARYERFFKSFRPEFLILDNSAAELDRPYMSELVDIAAHIKPSCICLPDVIGKREETVALIRSFLDGITTKEFVEHKWMAIPQGYREEEIIACARDIQSLLGRSPDYWGVPRWITNKLGSRSFITQVLMEPEFQNNKPYQKNIHLLGMSENLSDDIQCARMDVMGIDSANPVVLGLKGKDVMTQYSHSPRFEAENPNDYGTETIFNYWDEEEVNQQAVNNIVKFRSVIR